MSVQYLRCCQCRETKPTTEFYTDRYKANGYRSQCRECHKANVRAARLRNPEVKRAYNRKWYLANAERVKGQLNERRKAASAYVNDIKRQPCTDCGQTFPPAAMEFDHVRGTKQALISKMCNRGQQPAVIAAEIAKCDLVCANCHRIRHWPEAEAA